MKYLLNFFLTAVVLHLVIPVIAQPGTHIELDKPKKYENRKLGSEKTGDKKIRTGKRIYQDIITHYNYYFNANNRLNEVVENAKSSFKDDYTQLLPFYNYSLENTAQSSSDIDSIIYKCTAGILLHDLRNDWIDNLYMILGRAYFYRKDFDSAAAVFQYVNYAFSPKDDGYDIPIGSNVSNTNGIFTIATKEKNGLISHTPSRNNSFLWLARTYMEMQRPEIAAGILEILRHDPNYPQRLQNDLQETLAYWYYKQKVYDSSAWHLTKALDNAGNQFEKARWEFLIAQMYQLANDSTQAVAFYNRSAAHTPDPVMEVYANLNSIGISSGDKETILQQKLNNLLKLAKKDKYVSYRDIIYYAAAKVELERGNLDGAKELLNKSIKYSVDNTDQKTASFVLLADINYDNRDFQQAYNYYDSASTGSLKDSAELERVTFRHTALQNIVNGLYTINREDSLQQIAALPTAQREAVVKKVLKQLRKQQGLKEDANDSDNNSINPAVQLNAPADLFSSSATSSSSSKGDWYFNNTGLKATGFTEFRQKWGNRPNVDNWRRQSDVQKIAQAKTPQQNRMDSMMQNANGINPQDAADAVLTLENLENNLPLTEEKLQTSNDVIARSMLSNAETLQNQLENYPAAVEIYEELDRRFNNNKYQEQYLFNLYYCYNKLGNAGKADSCLALLKKDYSNGEWTKKLSPTSSIPVTSDKNPATKEYEHIYNLFLSGDFEKAKEEKAKADSIYGNSYWTPQLLFIESIYYVTTKQDSTAINKLNDIAERYAESPLAERAKIMVDVLRRRTEIENYLTNLQITRAEDEPTHIVDLSKPELSVKPVEVKRDSIISKPVTNVPVRVDTSHAAPVTVKTFTFNPSQPQYVLVLMDSVAPVYANEAKNAFNRFNRENFYNQKIDITSVKLDDRYNLVLMGPFSDAIGAVDYVDKARPVTNGRILPWLTPNKYSYSIISEENLDLLKDNKDVEGYKALLKKVMPDKF